MAGFFPKSKILKAIILNIFQHSKLCISARPCNVLYFFLLMIVSFTKIIFCSFLSGSRTGGSSWTRKNGGIQEANYWKRKTEDAARTRVQTSWFLTKGGYFLYLLCSVIVSFDCYWYLCSTIVVFVWHYVVYLSHNSSFQMTLRTWLIA